MYTEKEKEKKSEQDKAEKPCFHPNSIHNTRLPLRELTDILFRIHVAFHSGPKHFQIHNPTISKYHLCELFAVQFNYNFWLLHLTQFMMV